MGLFLWDFPWQLVGQKKKKKKKKITELRIVYENKLFLVRGSFGCSIEGGFFCYSFFYLYKLWSSVLKGLLLIIFNCFTKSWSWPWSFVLRLDSNMCFLRKSQEKFERGVLILKFVFLTVKTMRWVMAINGVNHRWVKY